MGKGVKIAILVLLALMVIALSAGLIYKWVSDNGSATTTVTGVAPAGGDTVPTLSKIATGRYVLIDRAAPFVTIPGEVDSSTVINLAGISVVDNAGSELITPRSVVTMGSRHSSFPASNFVDGNVNTFVHTTGANITTDWIMVDLGRDVAINKITLENRRDACCKHRIVGLRVNILDAAKNNVKTSPVINSAADTFTFTPVW